MADITLPDTIRQLIDDGATTIVLPFEIQPHATYIFDDYPSAEDVPDGHAWTTRNFFRAGEVQTMRLGEVWEDDQAGDWDANFPDTPWSANPWVSVVKIETSRPRADALRKILICDPHIVSRTKGLFY